VPSRGRSVVDLQPVCRARAQRGRRLQRMAQTCARTLVAQECAERRSCECCQRTSIHFCSSSGIQISPRAQHTGHETVRLARVAPTKAIGHSTPTRNLRMRSPDQEEHIDAPQKQITGGQATTCPSRRRTRCARAAHACCAARAASGQLRLLGLYKTRLGLRRRRRLRGPAGGPLSTGRPGAHRRPRSAGRPRAAEPTCRRGCRA